MSDAMSRSIREQVEGRHPMANDTTRLTDDECDRIARRMVEVFANTPLDSAPSDVKGEDDETDVVAVFAKLREISGNRWDSVDPDEYVRELRGGDCPLTPLTDPSVRGVLVDDGQPTHYLERGRLYECGGDVWKPQEDTGTIGPWQPVTLRPASEFGVAARGEPGLKKLPEGAIIFERTGEVRPPKMGEWFIAPDLNEVSRATICWADHADLHRAIVRYLDPALYAIPDGAERTAHDRSSLRVSIERDTARERIKELEAELADWKADTADQLCVNCSDPLEYQERADAEAVKHWSGIVAKKNADAERLRKAIKDAISWLNCSTVSEKSRKILLAALGSPPNAEHQRQGSSQASDQTSTAGGCNEPPSPAAASGETAGCDNHQWKFTGRVLTSYPGLYVMRCTVCGNEYQMPEEEYRNFKPTSAPAAESQGNAQHHSEGAKILDGGSGSSAAESEGGDLTDTELSRIAEFVGVQPIGHRLAVLGKCAEAIENLKNGIANHAASNSALSARLAACEERCRELEAGIEKHQRQMLDSRHDATNYDGELWSLLAPRAG